MKKIILCLTLLFCLPSLRAMDIAESSEGSEQISAEDNKVLLGGHVRQGDDVTVVAISFKKRLPRKQNKNKLYEAKIADLEKRIATLEKSMGVKTDNYGTKRKAKKQ
ncbi:MAG: dynactin subunit 2 [Candidatus Dependentiae bacterium]|nr:dynactin subunit 2 [Candidatus Dependentiae bacterium]